MVICYSDKRKLMQGIMSFHHHRYSSRAGFFLFWGVEICGKDWTRMIYKFFSIWIELSFFIFWIFSHNLNYNLSMSNTQIHSSSPNFSWFLTPHISFADIFIWISWNPFKSNMPPERKDAGIESLECREVNVVFPWRRNNKATLSSINEQNWAESTMKNSDGKISSAFMQQTI